MNPTPKARRAWTVAIPAALVIAGAAGAVWFLGRDVPQEASIDVAASLTTTTLVSDSSTSAAPTADFSVDGEWSIDTTIGDFSFAEATSTFAGFRIAEELSGIGATEAIGRTPVVSGSLIIEGGTVTDAILEADLTAIVSNESRRDDRIQSALNTSSNPIATFALTSPIEVSEDLGEGDTFTVTASGDLTINGVTKAVSFPLEGTVSGGAVLLAGGLDITFADFGVNVPSAPMVISVEDHGILEVQLWFTRA